MKTVERLLAEKLLKISAIKLQPENPFVWASGWNSPIYTDNRRTLSYPEVRTFIKVELCRVIMENFGEVRCHCRCSHRSNRTRGTCRRNLRITLCLCTLRTERPRFGKPYRRKFKTRSKSSCHRRPHLYRRQ